MTSETGSGSALFDLSLLPETRTQFLVVSDTHYLLPRNAQSVEWSAVDEFPARTERALRLAGSLPHDFAVHLGDVSHEYPETGRAPEARRVATAQFAANGLRFHQAAGNMDIGDKPDPTSPANWVSPETLAEWHEMFGPSWSNFDEGDFHGIVLNTQIMNGPMPEAEAQTRWAEEDLAANLGKRILLFLHMPIYFVERDEAALGFYNSLDEPARTWLLDLIDRYRIELAFAGHTHFVALNRQGAGRMYVAPSTATSRAGLAEAFTSPAPDRGRGDLDKLGFFFVRMGHDGSRVHLIRSGRETPALNPDDPARILVTGLPRDLPHGRLGVMASHPIGHMTPGPVIWPSIVRQPMRDDWRLFACLELGARSIRAPASDLVEPVQRERLDVLRDEGVRVIAYWLWSDQIDPEQSIEAHAAAIDQAEIVLPGATVPPTAFLDHLKALRTSALPIALSTAQRGEAGAGQYHGRTRVGFLPPEIAELAQSLRAHGAGVDRVICRLSDDDLWGAVEAVRHGLDGWADVIGGVDFLFDMHSEDDARNAAVMAEAIAAVATVPGAMITIGPLVDLDRSMDVGHGLIDRVSNPRSPLHVARCLNSLLFSSPEPARLTGIGQAEGQRVIDLDSGGRAMRIVIGASSSACGTLASGKSIVYDLAGGLSAPLPASGGLPKSFQGAGGPLLIVEA
jgi:hypothetical protein